jgi:glycogen operon protein
LKLIAEPWDMGPGGYKLGAFPASYHEWNDRYRDGARRYWRGDRGSAGDFATRFSGSSDLMPARGPLASVNFVTAHDGFTLEDLVSYDTKHNLENGENNTDGTNENYSWNCGAEGASDDPKVRALRERQKRNLMATLLLSAGVPMLRSGDELSFSQHGNNNAYCQDNETSWLDWDEHRSDAAAFLDFVRRVVALKRCNAAFRRETFYSGISANGLKDITWLHSSGREMTAADWQRTSAFGCALGEERFLLLFNPTPEPVVFVLPKAERGWRLVFDTAQESEASRAIGTECAVEAHSLLLLKEAGE